MSGACKIFLAEEGMLVAYFVWISPCLKRNCGSEGRVAHVGVVWNGETTGKFVGGGIGVVGGIKVEIDAYRDAWV